MTQNVEASTILSTALPELFWAGFPPPRERQGQNWPDKTLEWSENVVIRLLENKISG